MNFENDENLDFKLNKIASIVIKEKRIKKGYSLDDVVNKLGNIITKQSLFRYENNEARMKNKIFKKICFALDEDPNEVWEEINNRFLNNLTFDNAEYVDTSDIIQIPVFGTIKAGILIESQNDITEYVEIPKSWVKGGKKFFGLKISGDSMFPKYDENDIVIFQQNNDLDLFNGKDVAVMINHTESTFKKIHVNEQGIVLQPYNSAYDFMMFSKEQVEQLPIKVVGVAVEKRTRL